jgi:hypothetical protein
METTQFAKQTLEFQKTMFDNSFNAMTMVQDQTEKMVNDSLDQLPWATAEGKKTLQTSVDMTKKTRDDYKKAVDEGFSKLEQLLEEK